MMSTRTPLSFLCAILLVSGLGACQTINQLETTNQPSFLVDQTLIEGKVSAVKGVDAFLGVPFARAPIDDLRWRAPRQFDFEQSRRIDATEFGPACMQGPRIFEWYRNVIVSFGGDPDRFEIPDISEDCLYLNIWTPKQNPAQNKLPVMVYIHGGSNKAGWSYEPNYIGENMASKDVVVVSIAYRLGVFGFFSHPELQESNFGLLDMVQALKWIKRNIHKVGGDAERITVFGESAGASNIAYLMQSPKAQGLFHRAIHQSAGWTSYGTAEKVSFDHLALQLSESLLQDRNAPIEQLRQQDSLRVLQSAELVYQDHFFENAVNGKSLLEPFDIALDKQALTKVDLLIGTNRNEARMYLDPQETVDSWLAQNLPTLAADKAAAIKAKLPKQHPFGEKGRVDVVATSVDFTCPSFKLAAGHSAAGNNVWFYEFTRVRDGDLAAAMGAYHGAELPYVFDTHDDWLPTSDQDRQLGHTITDIWLRFASGEDLTQLEVVEGGWPVYSNQGDPVLTLNSDLNIEQYPNNWICDLIEEGQ